MLLTSNPGQGPPFGSDMLQYWLNYILLTFDIFNIIHMNCLLEFSKMTSAIHFIFTFVTGIIF